MRQAKSSVAMLKSISSLWLLNILFSIYIGAKVILSHVGNHSVITAPKVKILSALHDELTKNVQYNWAEFIIAPWIKESKYCKPTDDRHMFELGPKIRYGTKLSKALENYGVAALDDSHKFDVDAPPIKVTCGPLVSAVKVRDVVHLVPTQEEEARIEEAKRKKQGKVADPEMNSPRNADPKRKATGEGGSDDIADPPKKKRPY